ncbi:GAF and ANTAR domain-containing protein [Terrabacter aerolatus]|uniref:Transcriptional regulator n=1 Tax=Terrabacter aerolatus TaxID=422442 RepID=A0A512D1S5_9MICO|nr:GAF and ANTAR domain-containing protein [Terrabacter aerolatus]GEO30200.1 transcriptional regulator [Terrabacter aerolatus]
MGGDQRQQADEELREVAESFARLGTELESMDPTATLDALARLAVERVPGTRCASITSYEHGRFRTVAATDDLARRADAIQYALGSGPCLDAIVDDTLYRPKDLRHDDRWPEYGAKVSSELGLLSMLSYRLGHEVGDTIDGLNIYADEVAAFDERAELVGLMLATHGALAVALSANQLQVENLQRALVTNREIGVAMGILMARHHVTRDQAFGLLRMASQNANRKLHEVALQVSDTGALPPIGGDRRQREDVAD